MQFIHIFLEKQKEGFRMKNSKKPKWLDEFAAFAIKGNAMSLAVGTIIGAAFSTITKSITDDIIMPIVAIFMGGIDFSELKITLPACSAKPRWTKPVMPLPTP